MGLSNKNARRGTWQDAHQRRRRLQEEKAKTRRPKARDLKRLEEEAAAQMDKVMRELGVG